MRSSRRAIGNRCWIGGRSPRAKLGFVLLPNEYTVAADVARLAPAGVGTFCTRAPMPREITPETLEAMIGGLADAAALAMPDEELDVLCYAPTSGSLVMGEDRICAELERGYPHKVKTTTLVSGVVAGLRAPGAAKIVVGTPYLDSINQLERVFLEQRGFDVLDIQGLKLRTNTDMSSVTPDFLIEFALAIDRPDADAIFISCGALRSIEEIERRAGKPVVVSNQAMMWHCLRLAGIVDAIPGYGRLMSLA
jgi:maleate isomerase